MSLKIPFSLLDLAPVCEGSTPAQAFANSLDLARHAEALGYTRYWLAEHHNMPGIASAATSVLIGHVAGGTSRIRVGAGGVMLPNHAPLQVAEQFGTLASLYPDRIDLGLGRAPGTDQATAKALRRYYDSAEAFPQDVQEVLHYFEPVQPGQAVQAVPGGGLEVPVWILGSSLFGARPGRNARRRHTAGPAPPIDDIEAFWSPAEKAMVKDALACSVVGDATDLREGIAAFADRHRPDELMLTGNIFDHAARKHSFAVAAGAFIDTRLA